VIGCGNPLRGDDGVGNEVVRRLALRPLPSQVRCVDAGTSGLEIVLLMREAEAVVLIDAAAASDADHSRPGRLYELSAEEIVQQTAGSSSTAVSIHAVRWHDALALSRALGGPQPARLTCFLIEGSSFDHGHPLSPAVAATAEELACLLEKRLAEHE
jgi:hydrogenase maturation protease